MKIKKRTIFYLLGAITAATCSLWALYATLFWGWVTATPLTEAQLSRAQYNANTWLKIFVGCWLVVFVMIVCWVRGCRKLAIRNDDIT